MHLKPHHTDYFDQVIGYAARQRIIQKAVDELKDVDFDVIAVQGTSGLLFGPSIADALHKEVIVVRKSHDGSHSNVRIEGFTGDFKYIIIDDFVCSGSTVKCILTRIETESPEALCVGVYLYNTGWSQVKGRGFGYDGKVFPYLNTERTPAI